MEVRSKFWSRNESSSSSSGSEESDAGSVAESVQAKTTPAQGARKPTAASRWILDESSSEDERPRIVKSARDKTWEQMKTLLKSMHNYKKIEDFAQITTTFESLIRLIKKAQALTDKEGYPAFFIRALADLETYINERLSQRETFKKTSKAKHSAFNTLRAKVRKGLENYRFLLDEYYENPDRFSAHDDAEISESDESDSNSVLSSASGSSFSSSSSSVDDVSSHSESEMESSEDEEGSSDVESSEDDSSAASESSANEVEDGDEDRPQGAFGKTKAAQDSESEWGGSEPSQADDLHEMGLKRWGKKADLKPKRTRKSKAEKTKGTRGGGKTSGAAAEYAADLRAQPQQQLLFQQQLLQQHLEDKTTSIIAPGERVDAELITKKLQEVIAVRGRKGGDRAEQLRHLTQLADAAKNVSPQSQIDALGHLISAHFDTGLGAFACMTSEQWDQCYEAISQALRVLTREKDCYFPFVATDEDEGKSDGERGGAGEGPTPPGAGTGAAKTSGTTTPAQISAAVAVERTPGSSAVARPVSSDSSGGGSKARASTSIILASFVQRLDDELGKALQLADIHSEDYRGRLCATLEMLALLWRAHLHFRSLGTDRAPPECEQTVNMRILEHIYYKKNKIAASVWEFVRRRLESQGETEAAAPLASPDFHLIILPELVQESLGSGVPQMVRVRAMLYAAYNTSLHGRFHEARDLLLTSNLQELSNQCSVSTQILFNRNLVQLALAAFRSGLINEAHSYLSEVCAMGRYKELMAQAVSIVPRGVEKSADQERIESKRLLPYHMHISSEMVEAVHNVCAMLLEVPYMAAYPFDYTKKPIARNFRRLLELYEKQMFTGPPENSRETIMAATKALQKGNWKQCADLICGLQMWDYFEDAPQVKETLVARIKQEALRTYLFTYSSLYDSLSITQLAKMFGLQVSVAHSIVSKMMIQGSLSGSWDDSSECVLMNSVEQTPLQVLALQLAEKTVQTTDQNDILLNFRSPSSRRMPMNAPSKSGMKGGPNMGGRGEFRIRSS